MNSSNLYTCLTGLFFKLLVLNAYGTGLALTPLYAGQGSQQQVDCPDLGLDIGDACDDGKDNTVNDIVKANCECSGVDIDEDLDEDGFTKELDCDDTNPNINPNMSEIPDNGIDEDCSGADLTQAEDPDLDQDGTTLGNGDCDDSDPNVYPGAPEILDNGIDEDCNGIIDDITSAQQENRAISSFEIFPNPASEYLQITFKNPPRKAFRIQIVDMLGKVVYQKYIDHFHQSSISISTQSYSNGFYILSIRQNGQLVAKKFMCLN